MNIAFVGTGFVADYYMTTLKNFPELRLCGVFDRSASRMTEFSAFHNVQTYESAEAVMDDPAVKSSSTSPRRKAISRFRAWRWKPESTCIPKSRWP